MNRVIPVSVRFLEKIISNSSLLARVYSLPYREVVKREIELAGLTAGEEVLQVGSGPVPFTAVHLAVMAGVKVTTIDNDSRAVLCGRRCIKRMGLEDQVKIEHGDGTSYPPGECRAAFIALQAEPKEEILHNMLSRCRPGFRLVLRQPQPHLYSWYDPAPAFPVPEDRISQGQATFSHSLMYTGEQYRSCEVSSF